jgi:hypothetical protein
LNVDLACSHADNSPAKDSKSTQIKETIMSTQEVLKPTNSTGRIAAMHITRGIALCLALAFCYALSAQTTATWQGGKPGRTTDWSCPANWSGGHVPDEFTQVIIPSGKQFYPVIKCAATPIDALLIESGSTLAIHAGASLVILGETGRFEGFTVLGQIRNDGTLDIGEAVNISTAFLKQVQGNGIVISPTVGMDTLARRR